MGWVEEGVVRWACVRWACNSPVVQVNHANDAINNIVNAAAWPWVEIVMNHAGASGRAVDALVREGVQGLVVACTGNGTIHHDLEAALVRAQNAGVRVVRSTRCAEGQVLPKPGDALPASQGLSPVKARVALMLDLLRMH